MMSTSDTTGPTAEAPASDPDTARRIAQERRIAREGRATFAKKDAHWLTVEQALKIEGTTDPTRLRMELKNGLPCQFRHRGRWWQIKPVEEVAPLLAGRNPFDLQDQDWELVVHERWWCERLNKPAAPMPPADVPSPATEKVPLRDASDDEVRVAMRAIYGEKGDERPNSKKIVPLVLDRLKTEGLYAKWDTVRRIIREKEFQDRRNRVGRPPRKLKKSPGK
jgi:hypothetical protein